MKELINIKRSLISVSNKKNIVNLASALTKQGIEIISTGNTYNTLVKSKVNAKKIEKPELIAKHAPKVNKKQVKQRKMIFGAPPGFGSRLPANATSPKIVPYKNDTAFTLGERLEMGWNMVGENHELRIDKTEMAAAEARKNADWHGKYKPLNNKEFHSFVMSRRKRSGGATS